ncbi:MAG TPA: hypothetical protein VM686_12725 [Polyangiaceae bacterium]|nr:hypothetical protein [Polyangiaceae bacterium]
MATEKGQEIAVHVSLPDDERTREATLALYAFSAGGKLLDAQQLQSSGEVTLRVPLGAEGTNVRVMVGPALKDAKPALADLVRRGALERHVRVDLQAKRPSLKFAIDIDKILCWLRSFCTVNGTVLKRTELSGQSIDLPVCNATVEVYEVDPLLIVLPKLPDDLLDRLREVIVRPIPLPEPPPEPLPGPFPGPFPPGPRPGPFLPSAPTALIARKTAAPVAARSHSDVAFALAENPEAEQLRFAARAASNLEFRKTLLDYAVLVRPLLCALFPRFFTMQLVATAKTDDCGHFHAIFFHGCNNPDKPDLYFKVKQRFVFWDITIYAPTPVPCYTWWNYTCGSEVTLVTHHPFAHTCSPCAPVVAGENWVLFTAIGATSLNLIYGDSPDLQGATTSTNRGLLKSGAPFGGTLRPQLLFDNALRENLGVKYYKLFYRRVGTSAWLPMLGDVHRHYTYDPDGSGGSPPVSALYKLGPLSPPEAPKANLFEIPPALAPKGVWGPVIAPTDYENGEFDTTLSAPGISYATNGAEVGADASGKFEIRLELFDTNGDPVDIAAKGIKYFVPDVDDLTGTITTQEAAPLGLVHGNAMVITVHVDNNPTFAEIDAPTIASTAADPCCGVLEFAPSDWVTIPWRAKHKNGFATFTFSTKRVDQVVFSQPSTPVGLVGNFSTVQNAQVLMDTNLPVGCPLGGCSMAAFASYEYVTALATDGWSRLHYLDSLDFEAFALKKS